MNFLYFSVPQVCAHLPSSLRGSAHAVPFVIARQCARRPLCHCEAVRTPSPLSLRTSPQTGVAISDAEQRISWHKKIPTAVCALPRNDGKGVIANQRARRPLCHCFPSPQTGVAIFPGSGYRRRFPRHYARRRVQSATGAALFLHFSLKNPRHYRLGFSLSKKPRRVWRRKPTNKIKSFSVGACT